MCKVNSSAGDNSDIRIHHNQTLLCFEFNSQLRIEFQIKRQRGQQRRHTEADLQHVHKIYAQSFSGLYIFGVPKKHDIEYM